MKKKALYTVMFILLILLTVIAVTDQSSSFSAEGFAAYIAGANKGWLAAAVACMLSFILCEGLALLTLCDALGYRQGFRSGLLYSASDIYFSAITPSATGGQPASALFMMRDGIPGVVTAVALLLNLALYTLSILLIGLFCFLLRPKMIVGFGVGSRILIALGIFTQILLFVGFLLLIFREKILMKIIDLFMRIAQKLRLGKQLENRRARLEALERDYKACSGIIRGQRKRILLALLLNIAQRASIILVPLFVYLATGGQAARIADVFAAQGLVVLGSNSIPIPGAVGVSDYLFLDGFGAFVRDPVNLELLSRGISFYSCVLLCALILLGALILRRKNRRKQS